MIRTRRGSSFIVVLAVLVGLVSLLAGIAVSQRNDLRALSSVSERQRAEAVVDSAVRRVMAELILLEDGPRTINDDWALLGNVGDEEFLVGNASFRIEVLDASGRIDLNTVPEDQLRRLPMTNEQIDSLLDWREEERAPRAEGAKDEFYNGLATPYNAALRSFESVEDLLLVRGFTPIRLYELQTDVQTSVTLVQGDQDSVPPLYELFTVDTGSAALKDDGTAKTNANQGNLQNLGLPGPLVTAIVNARPITSYEQMLNLPGVNQQNAEIILNELVPNGNPRQLGKINLNTATEAVLNSVPDMTPDVAQSILSRQSTGFLNLGELATLPGVTTQLLAQIADAFTTSTDTFLVRIQGRAGNTRIYREVMIRTDGDLPTAMRSSTPPYPNVLERWNWSEEPSTQTTLAEVPE